MGQGNTGSTKKKKKKQNILKYGSIPTTKTNPCIISTGKGTDVDHAPSVKAIKGSVEPRELRTTVLVQPAGQAHARHMLYSGG